MTTTFLFTSKILHFIVSLESYPHAVNLFYESAELINCWEGSKPRGGTPLAGRAKTLLDIALFERKFYNPNEGVASRPQPHYGGGAWSVERGAGSV